MRAKRKIDILANEASAFRRRELVFVSRKKIASWKAYSILTFVLGAVTGSILLVQMNMESQSRAEYSSFAIQKMKTRGCIADGILTGSGGDTSGAIALIKRSKCEYLHRAIETWRIPPDFSLIAQNKNKINKEDMIYGMFLAEAIGTDAVYFYPDEKREFNFSEMCRGGSEGFWGDKTCKANFGSSEYRKYLSYITKKAIDLGIQSFMFGQIYFQENGNLAKSIVEEMRAYARSKNKGEIIIGAQTGDITDEKYLKIFDYIEGGVGINDEGEIESGPCWSKLGGCWALLWNEKFSSKAKNVFLHLDWSGLSYDDMSRFARMDNDTRTKTLSNLYNFFTAKNMGFLMPYLAVVYDRNGGCTGPQINYYSPDNKYSCKDEDKITAIFQGIKSGNDAKFLTQTVPTTMVAGQEYKISISVKNTGTKDWSDPEYRMGSQNIQDNNFWGGRIYFSPKEIIKSGQTKVFNFSVKAPAVPGIYNFQWKMVQEGKEWFGEQSENVKVTVGLPATTTK